MKHRILAIAVALIVFLLVQHAPAQIVATTQFLNNCTSASTDPNYKCSDQFPTKVILVSTASFPDNYLTLVPQTVAPIAHGDDPKISPYILICRGCGDGIDGIITLSPGGVPGGYTLTSFGPVAPTVPTLTPSDKADIAKVRTMPNTTPAQHQARLQSIRKEEIKIAHEYPGYRLTGSMGGLKPSGIAAKFAKKTPK